MSPESETFQIALRQAGQPWSRWGVRITGLGVIGLLVAQVAATQLTQFLFLASVVVVAAGWSMLVTAFFKRRRWVAEQRLENPPLPDPGALDAP
jgi:hypothetical protein